MNKNKQTNRKEIYLLKHENITAVYFVMHLPLHFIYEYLEYEVIHKGKF